MTKNSGKLSHFIANFLSFKKFTESIAEFGLRQFNVNDESKALFCKIYHQFITGAPNSIA